MRKTLAILFAALCCITANAQEINAVFTRPSDGNQNHYQITCNPNVVLGNDNTITLKLGDAQEGQPYTLTGSNTYTVLFGSAISEETAIGEGLAVSHPIVIESGGKLTVSGTMSNTNAQDLVIEDGGQLVFNSGTVNATVKKEITGYGTGNGDWYFVASPITGTNAPAGIGMTEGEYDLYSFNQNFSHTEWRNYKAQAFNIENQNGYLYAHKNGTTLTFNGELIASASAKPLAYDGNATFKGFNLIGNPLPCNATIKGTDLRSSNYFYMMNTGGTALEVVDNPVLAPCTGVFAVAASSGATVTFSPANVTRGERKALRDIRVELLADGNIIDRAYLNTNGESLPKFTLSDNTSEICFYQAKEKLAVASASATRGEMPLNFKAVKNGTYTIMVNVGNVDLDYLHLVDNLTGNDVDLLCDGMGKDVPWRVSTQGPTYTFDAKTSDYASRFKLVFGMKDTEPAEVTDTFAYISNGEIIVSNEGRATLQLIDAMGRIIRNYQIEGEARISTQGLTAGVYILTLNGMTQKIVVR